MITPAQEQLPPQILANQLTLSQPGGLIMPTPVLPAPPPGFLTLAACLRQLLVQSLQHGPSPSSIYSWFINHLFLLHSGLEIDWQSIQNHLLKFQKKGSFLSFILIDFFCGGYNHFVHKKLKMPPSKVALHYCPNSKILPETDELTLIFFHGPPTVFILLKILEIVFCYHNCSNVL